jgi:hypothetical protein
MYSSPNCHFVDSCPELDAISVRQCHDGTVPVYGNLTGCSRAEQARDEQHSFAGPASHDDHARISGAVPDSLALPAAGIFD